MTALVVDASAVVDFVRATPVGRKVHARLRGEALHVPHLCAVEVASALRGLVLARKMTDDRAQRALHDAIDLHAERHPVEPLLGRVWALRHNLTAYDAVYVALAEALDAILVTSDSKMGARTVRKLITVDVVR